MNANLRDRRWKKLQKHTLRWCVIRQYIILESISNSKHLSEIKKLINDWNLVNITINHVEDYYLDEYDFEVIRRFVRIEQINDRCEYKKIPEISMESYINIQEINLEKSLMIVYDNYKAYWEGVLMSYKRSSYRINRLKKLIESLTDDLNDPVTNYPIVRNKITTLIDDYNKDLLSLK